MKRFEQNTLRLRTNCRGFTLIEVLISIVILSFIALGIYQNTTQSFDLREKLDRDGEFYNSIRVALDILRRDLIQIYTPQQAALPDSLLKTDGSSPTTSGTGNYSNDNADKFWAAAINSVGVRPSRFQGDSSTLSFIANSNLRMVRDSRKSDLVKVSYTVEEDKLAPKGTQALVKHVDTDVFSEKNTTDTEMRYTLLSGVKAVQFRYLDGEKDSWNKRWDTVGIDHPGVYPAVIEVEVEVYYPDAPGAAGANIASNEKRTFKVTQRCRPELPI